MAAPEESELYFSYGSNLDRVDWEAWCARTGHRPDSLAAHRPAWLVDHELAFHYRSAARGGGALDVVRHAGRQVSGVLFRVGAGGWEALDEKEGVAERRYVRVALRVRGPGGRWSRAHTYAVHTERRVGFTPPTADYFDIVARGLASHGLATEPLAAAARGDAQRAVHELRERRGRGPGYWAYRTTVDGGGDLSARRPAASGGP